jgi:hypothetical protein
MTARVTFLDGKVFKVFNVVSDKVSDGVLTIGAREGTFVIPMSAVRYVELS